MTARQARELLSRVRISDLGTEPEIADLADTLLSRCSSSDGHVGATKSDIVALLIEARGRSGQSVDRLGLMPRSLSD